MCDGAEAVVLREGVLVEQQPLRQSLARAPGSVSGQRVHLGHVFVGQDEVVARSIHITRHLKDTGQVTVT